MISSKLARSAIWPPTGDVESLLRREYRLSPACVRLWRSGTNEIYHVVDHDRRAYYLRCSFPGSNNAEEVLWELDMLQYAAAQGAPVSVPVASVAGSPMITTGDVRTPGRICALFGSAGEILTHDATSAASLGEALAQFHEVNWSELRAPPQGRRYDPHLVLREAKSLATLYVGVEGAYRLRCLLLPLQPFIEESMTAAASFRPCHGDVQFSNACLSPSGVRLYDFDDCFKGPIAYDIGSAFWSFSSQYGRHAPLLFGPFLNRYRSISGRDIDMRSVLLFAVLRDIAQVIRTISTAPIAGWFRVSEKTMNQRLSVTESLIRKWTSHGGASKNDG